MVASYRFEKWILRASDPSIKHLTLGSANKRDRHACHFWTWLYLILIYLHSTNSAKCVRLQTDPFHFVPIVSACVGQINKQTRNMNGTHSKWFARLWSNRLSGCRRSLDVNHKTSIITFERSNWSNRKSIGMHFKWVSAYTLYDTLTLGISLETTLLPPPHPLLFGSFSEMVHDLALRAHVESKTTVIIQKATIWHRNSPNRRSEFQQFIHKKRMIWKSFAAIFCLSRMDLTQWKSSKLLHIHFSH